MRRTRFMTLLFLAMSIAFFGVADFRWGLRLGALAASENYGSMLRGGLSTAKLDDIAEQAQAAHDARRLAFVALRMPDERVEDAFRLAQQAISYDSTYTWVLFDLVGFSYFRGDLAPPVMDLLPRANAQVRAWDPQNGAPFLEQAAMIRQADPKWPANPIVAAQQLAFAEKVAAKTEWREAMSRAFAAARYDDYSVRRFELDRSVLSDMGTLRPDTMLASLLSRPYFWTVTPEFSIFRVEYEAPRLAAAGRRDEAQRLLREGVLFGARLALNGTSRQERVQANRVEKQFGEALLAALRKENRTDEANLLDMQLTSVRNRESLWKQDALSGTSAPAWFGLLVGISCFGVVLFGAATVFVFVALFVCRKAEVSVQNPAYRLLHVGGNYLPVLLFFASLSLYIVYTPYANNFRQYTAADLTQVHRMDAFLINVIPFTWLIWDPQSLPLENPFMPYAWWALAMVALAAALKWLEDRKRFVSR